MTDWMVQAEVLIQVPDRPSAAHAEVLVRDWFASALHTLIAAEAISVTIKSVREDDGR